MTSNNPYAPYPNQYAAAPSSGYNSAVHTPDAQHMQNNMARLQMMAAQYQQQQQQQALLAALAAQNPVQIAQQRQQYMVLQQAQMDMQMRQLQMAQLAMQQNHQQQQQALLMQQHQQQQQQQEQQAAQSTQSAQVSARHSRASSASPVIEQRALQSWTSNTGDPLPAPSASRVAAARELSSLQTRTNRHNMLPSPLSPATSASDWQAKRMSFPAAARNVSAPLQGTYQSSMMNAGIIADSTASVINEATSSLHPSIREPHRKTPSMASADSTASSNSVCSPNRGPALVLSVPGEECDETETSTDADASMITHDADASGVDFKQAKRQSRHTVILSSQLPPAAGLAAAAKELHQRRASQSSTVSASDKDSQPSSGNSSPTSDRSDIVSFDSNETGHTSLEESSPTKSSNFAGLAIEGTPRASAGKSLNPSATEFSPPIGDAATPQGRPASSRLRSGSPPAAITGAVTVTILRQPKGPANESELASKNFAGVIRRKAVGALRLATSGGSSSRLPASLASPLVEQFGSMGLGRPVPVLASLNTGSQVLFHGRAVTSPNVASFPATTPHQEAFSASATSSTFADFGAQLAQRAMKRRSAQLAAGNPTPTTASQPLNYGLGMYQQ